MKNYECDGQMNIFDYLKPENSSDEIIRYSNENRFINQMTMRRCKCGDFPKEYFYSSSEYFVKCGCGATTATYKHAYESIQAWNFERLVNAICQHSNHECNKKELWAVADSLDETQCPHICCRKCATKNCGARCNGSKEPPTVRLWHRLCKVKPETSGYYEVMDIKGKRDKAWYEQSRGDFDHVTGFTVECWKEN